MTLREVDIAPPEVRLSKETIEVLRRALERAERGELQEVMIVAVEEDGSTWYTYTSTLQASRRVGMLEWIKAIFMRDWLAAGGE